MHFNPYFSQVYSTAKVGIKMHLVCVSSQLLISVLFIVVSTNTENTNLLVITWCCK